MNRNECNLSLDELLKFDGVMAAGIFSPEGKLVDYKSKRRDAKRDGTDDCQVLRSCEYEVRRSVQYLHTALQNKRGTSA